MKSKNPFYELPSPALLRTEKGIEEFRKIIKYEEENKVDNYMLKIKFLIYIKLIFNLWEINDYKEFKHIFSRMDDEKMNFLGSSVIKCLESSNFTIYEELKCFSEEVNWYPVKVKNDNNNYIKKDMKLLDCFDIVVNLEKYMKQFISNYSIKLFFDFEKMGMYMNVEEQFIKEFEEEFGFLMNYSLFRDVYINIKKESINILNKCIYRIESKNSYKKNNDGRIIVSREAKDAAKGQRDHYRRKIKNGSIVFERPQNRVDYV